MAGRIPAPGTGSVAPGSDIAYLGDLLELQGRDEYRSEDVVDWAG
jgi:hypothetical protein